MTHLSHCLSDWSGSIVQLQTALGLLLVKVACLHLKDILEGEALLDVAVLSAYAHALPRANTSRQAKQLGMSFHVSCARN